MNGSMDNTGAASRAVPALELKNVSKFFGGVHATEDVSLAVEQRAIYGIIGPNGAGKTTIFNMITGVYVPTEGDILFMGSSIVGKQPFEIARLGIARTFQNIRLFQDMSVYTNLHVACQGQMRYGVAEGILRMRRYREDEAKCAAKCAALLERMGLSDIRDMKAGNLPYGLQRRLEIARALATEPRLLLLDEPAAGMNDEESEEMSRTIRRIRDEFEDITVIVIDHHMDVIMDVCEKISVINFGRQIACGASAEIQDDQEVIDAYLGTGD